MIFPGRSGVDDELVRISRDTRFDQSRYHQVDCRHLSSRLCAKKAFPGEMIKVL